MMHLPRIHCAPPRGLPAHARRSHGFTLVELLVVVAIILVLAAFALAVLNAMRKTALKAREMNNLRNISQTVLAYVNDHRVLPGPVFRGVRLPSSIGDGERINWLSTVLIDSGLLSEDDDVWRTTVTGAPPLITYVINSTPHSVPTYFFGRIDDPVEQPKMLTALRANLAQDLGGRESQGLTELWMLATADHENYGADPLNTNPLASGSRSKWGGRFYSFFDGRVDFIPRRTPSQYPSSFLGGHQ